MKISILATSLLSCLFMECSYSQSRHTPGMGDNMDSKGIAIVELFTSEGCSSCPPADALMPVLKDEFKDNVIILSFHVDYWNRLGWKDPYSSSDYSRRQNQYASALGSDNVYTPQAIVNGTEQTTGGNQQGLTQLIKRAAAKTAAGNINLTAHHEGNGETLVAYKIAAHANGIVCLALVQVHASTDVRSGENGGRTLKHFNVVRDFRTARDSAGEVRFTLPDHLGSDRFHVVAFVQDARTMQITSGKEIAIE